MRAIEASLLQGSEPVQLGQGAGLLAAKGGHRGPLLAHPRLQGGAAGVKVLASGAVLVEGVERARHCEAQQGLAPRRIDEVGGGQVGRTAVHVLADGQ